MEVMREELDENDLVWLKVEEAVWPNELEDDEETVTVEVIWEAESDDVDGVMVDLSGKWRTGRVTELVDGFVLLEVHDPDGFDGDETVKWSPLGRIVRWSHVDDLEGQEWFEDELVGGL